MDKKEILAAIDIGTNSFHLVVAETIDRNSFNVLTRDKEVVRLGSSSKDMKHITPEAMDRAIDTLKRFKLVCDSFEAPVRAVATSATREAKNKDEFIRRAYEETGIEIEVISGYEEGRLIYLGVLQALPVYDRRIFLIDIGGGSTEFLICEKGNISFSISQKIGAVRLTHKFFSDRKIKESAVSDARKFIKGEIHPVKRALKNEKFDMVVGSSGTFENIGLMILNEESPEVSKDFTPNNYTYTKDSFFNLEKKILKAGTIDEISKIPGLDSRRADIITSGVLIVEQVFKELGVKEITLSNFALREGILLDTIQKKLGTKNLGHLNNVRQKSVMNLANMTHFEKKHSEQVTKLALKIFDFVKDEFKLSEIDKEYLEAASLLHDIGYHISHSKHHKHSYYLIRNSEMLGFNDREIEIIANIARYHRKSHPKPKHYTFGKLEEEKERQTVRILAGILRIADGLDRSHNSSVKDLEFTLKENKLKIKLIPEVERILDLELWGAERRKELFEETTGYKVKFTL